MNKDVLLPSPADLAKKQKDTLKNVSLRIKQNTYDIFDVMAKKENSSASAMMISLLDFYAENYRVKQKVTDEDLAIEMMESYLRKATDNLLKLDDDARVLKFTTNGVLEDLMATSEINDLSDIKTILCKLKNGTAKEDDLPLCCIFGNIIDYYGFDYIATKKGDQPNFDTEAGNNGTVYEGFVKVPAEKWAIGANILALYQKRTKELKPDAYTVFTEKISREIFEAGVQTKTVEEYAWKLVDILLMFWKGLNE